MTQLIESRPYKLSIAISNKEKERVELVMYYGLTDERTIKCSQQLDNLLNKYTNEKQLYPMK